MSKKTNVVENEKWKKTLLKIALIFQSLRIATVILVITLQQPISRFIWKEWYRDYGIFIPIESVLTLILSIIVFFICYKLLKNSNEGTHIKKEIVSIVLIFPVYNIINGFLISVGNVLQRNIIITEYYTAKNAYTLSYISFINKIISQLQQYVFGYGLILLAIVAAISIGKKITNK